MGLLVKEALRILCQNNAWSYAVFWKIASQNPSLFVWEEGHHELATHSGSSGISKLQSTQPLPNDWDMLLNPPNGHSSELRREEEEGINILVNRMMLKQVHVLGEGIVGRAAFVGNHQWIHQDSRLDCKTMPENLAELKHQFLAGIQTVVVIPVLPFGVAQLGSTQMIAENLEFINQVKHLFVQLGSVPGTFSSGMSNGISHEMHVPFSLGKPVNENLSRNASTFESFPPVGGNCLKKQFLRTPASRFSSFVSQPCSASSFQDFQALLLQPTPNITSRSSDQSDVGLLPPDKLLMSKPLIFQTDREENEGGATQTNFPNSDMQLNERLPQQSISSGSSNAASVIISGKPCHNLISIDHQIFLSEGSDEVPHVPSNNYRPAASNNREIPYVGFHQNKAAKDMKSSVAFQLHCKTELPIIVNGTVLSNQHGVGITVNGSPSCPPPAAIGLQSDMGLMPISKYQNNSNGTQLSSFRPLPNCSSKIFKHAGTEETTGQKVLQKLLLESLESSLADAKEPISWSGCMPASSLEVDCSNLSSLKANEGTHYAVHGDGEINVSATLCRESLRGPNENQPYSKISDKFSNVTAGASPAKCDLFEALGLDYNSQKGNCGWDKMLLCQDDVNAEYLREDFSRCLPPHDVPVPFDSMSEGFCESGIFSDSGTDNLLDAVVSMVHLGAKQVQDDHLSCKTMLTRATGSSIHNSVYGGMEQNQEEQSGHCMTRMKSNMVESCPPKTPCNINKAGETSEADGVHKSQISAWVENGMKCASVSTAFSKRAVEAGKPNRKRPRPGENPRPRPRDRQMIQDRVKELREIVPNGAKCSIDALLERTIKHMVFLQSVTKHADKLKQTGDSNVNRQHVSSLKDNSGGGKTLAFEVNSQSLVCPIIVEDLNEPRQMRIEILCEERGFFLEIADIIRGLGLTILKGVMEACDDKVWACFAVEANKDVTRMNIFLSLMHLLQQTMKGRGMTQPNGFNGDNVGRNIFHQTAFPMTGLADALP